MFILNTQTKLFVINSSLVARMDPTSTPSTQMSGFYGPGAWAAWVITLIASWISLIQSDYGHNLHFIGYSLYTNWAAVDLIRQISQAPRDHSHLKINQAHLEGIVASSAVMSMGICQAVAQIALQLLRWESPGSDSKPFVRRRLLFLNFGLLIPLCTTWWYILIVQGGIGSYLVEGSSLLGHFIVACSVRNLVEVDWAKKRSVVLIFISPLTLLPMLIMLDMLGVGQLLPSFTDDIRPPSRCFIVPCAPQGIGEWDQAFSLFVALFLWVYEFRFGWIVNLKENIQACFKAEAIADEASALTRVSDENEEAFEGDTTSSFAGAAGDEV
jgi:hypothetical protein